MKIKLTILLLLVLFCINSVFSQTLYKVQAKQDGQVIKGKWTSMPENELKIHMEFKKDAILKAEKPVDIEGRLKKQISTWTKDNIIRVETHIYDPKRVIVKEGYKPVDIAYVKIQKKPQ